MTAHDKNCPAYVDPERLRDDGSCDCGATMPVKKSMGATMDAIGQGCAVSFGRVLGGLLAWAIMLWLFRHDIGDAAAWFAAHVKVVP